MDWYTVNLGEEGFKELKDRFSKIPYGIKDVDFMPYFTAFVDIEGYRYPVLTFDTGAMFVHYDVIDNFSVDVKKGIVAVLENFSSLDDVIKKIEIPQ